jgi:hypothetical protein
MNHLTTIEVFQIVDDTIANGVRTKIFAHLEVCPRCRQEVELQRTLLRIARSAPTVKPSAQLTSRVLELVAPRSKKTWSTRVVNNLSNFIALGIVLSVLWYAALSPAPVSGSAQPSMFTDAVKTYVDYYTRARDFVSREEVRLMGDPAKVQPTKSEHVMLMTIGSLLILVLVDRFVVRRFIRTQS